VKSDEQDSDLQKLTGSWRHRLRAPDSGEGYGNTWEPAAWTGYDSIFWCVFRSRAARV